MDNLSVFNEQQLKEIVYDAVSKCLDEKITDSLLNNKDEVEGFYNRNELCELLHISYPSLWRIEKSGILKSQKVGRKNLYSKAEVNQLMKSGKLAKYNRNRK